MSEAPAAREDRLNEVIAEFLAREDEGQPADPASVLAKHPDLEAELRSFFENRAGFARSPPTSHRPPSRTPGRRHALGSNRSPADPGLVPDRYGAGNSAAAGWASFTKSATRPWAAKPPSRWSGRATRVRCRTGPLLGEARAAAARPRTWSGLRGNLRRPPVLHAPNCAAAGRRPAGPLPLPRPRPPSCAIGRAVQHAHDRDRYRDLKPANVLLSADRTEGGRLQLAKQFDCGFEFTPPGR